MFYYSIYNFLKEENCKLCENIQLSKSSIHQKKLMNCDKNI